MTIYSSCLKDIKEAWFVPNMDTLKGWGQYLGLGLPGCLMVFLEFLVYEGLVIMAGLIGVQEMSSLSLIINLGTFLFAIPFSLSLVICIYVGNALGEANSIVASEAAQKCFKVGFLIFMILNAILLTFKN